MKASGVAAFTASAALGRSQKCGPSGRNENTVLGHGFRPEAFGESAAEAVEPENRNCPVDDRDSSKLAQNL